MTIRRRPRKPVRSLSLYHASPVARALFQTIIDSMSDGVMVIDQDGHIAVVNPALCGILGCQADQMLGKSWAELFFDQRAENDAFNDVVLDVIQNRVCHFNRQVAYHPPGQAGARELIVTTDLLLTRPSQREFYGVLVAFKDVTEITALHRQTQELLEQGRRLYQEKLEGLGRLALAVAHEIRNPVMSIGGLSKRLLDRCQDQEQNAAYLERIMAGSRRLELIVQQVQSYAKLPAPKPAPLELDPWLRGLAPAWAERARERGMLLKLPEQPPQPAIWARGEAKLLARLLEMLVDNALEAMGPGGVLSLGLARLEDPSRALISLADTGKGIDPGDMPYIFDPFFSTKPDRVGMSLATARRIAQEQGGELWAASQPGQGATFSLTLPLAEPPALAAASTDPR